jgi:hypothetical protein
LYLISFGQQIVKPEAFSPPLTLTVAQGLEWPAWVLDLPCANYRSIGLVQCKRINPDKVSEVLLIFLGYEVSQVWQTNPQWQAHQ